MNLMKTMAIVNLKVWESKRTCPKGVSTEGGFLEGVRLADRRSKKKERK